MQYDDYQSPDENSVYKMQKEYAKEPRKVSAMQNSCVVSTDKNCIFGSIDWSRNNNLLRLLANRAPSIGITNFIRGLSDLSAKDQIDLISLFPTQSSARTNPRLNIMTPTTFNTTLREYVRDELGVLAVLNNLLFLEEEGDTRSVLYNIISRRIDALNTLAGLINGGIFG